MIIKNEKNTEPHIFVTNAFYVVRLGAQASCLPRRKGAVR